MGDLQVGGTYRDVKHIIETATGNPFLGQVPTVVVVDEGGVNAGAANATEYSNGDYYFDVTPDAAGTWELRWACAGGTFTNNFITTVKVGGGEVTNIKAETALIKVKTDLIPSDPAETSDITTAHSTTNGLVTTVDTVVDAIKLKTDTIPSDPAETSDITTAHSTTNGKIDVIDAFHDVPAADAATNTVIRDVVGNKTDTVAGTSLVGLAKAIKAKTDALPTDPADDSDLDAAIAVIDGFHDVPTADAATDAQIRDVVGRKTDTAQTTVGDTSSIMRYVKALMNRSSRQVCQMIFWSDDDDDITLTTTATADHALPNVVVAGIPTGATLLRVVALLKIALIRDTSTADNAINGATTFSVDAASDYSSVVTAINIADNSWSVDVSTSPERSGDCKEGDNDIKAEVTGNGTFYGRLENCACDGNNLLLKEIGWGLKVYFTL